jgi:hypothetical protein
LFQTNIFKFLKNMQKYSVKIIHVLKIPALILKLNSEDWWHICYQPNSIII